jgi:excisionase family DNA binding protein
MVIGVVVILDRWLREVSKREERAMASLARQLGAQLVHWTRPAETALAQPVRSLGSGSHHAHPAGAGLINTTAAGAAEAGEAGLAVAARPQLLRSQEVAELFDVTERTVINWAAAGKLPSLRTIGGHLRFRREDVARLLAPPVG